MDQIFNELSANGSYGSKYDAYAGMERLARLSRAMAKIGFGPNLRTVRGFEQLPISHGYRICDWVNEKVIGVDKDIRAWFLTFASKSPYIEDFMEESQDNSLVEFKFGDDICLGLGLAHLWGCGALSLDGDVRFTEPDIKLSRYSLEDDGSESTELVEAKSWYSEDQLPSIGEVFNEIGRRSITDGAMLLSESPTLFPSLRIGEGAAKSLRTLTGSEQHFPEIIHHFRALDKAMCEWAAGGFSPQGIKWSGESKSTKARFFKERRFVCSDGKKRQFNYHSKIMSANFRIYYIPDQTDRVVYIGYVGKHLPTTKHRT